MIRDGGVSGAPLIARHLWRMCFALFFACANFFLGQQKVMPAFMHGSPFLFVPEIAVLALMIFWLIRVRFANRFSSEATAGRLGNAGTLQALGPDPRGSTGRYSSLNR